MQVKLHTHSHKQIFHTSTKLI